MKKLFFGMFAMAAVSLLAVACGQQSAQADKAAEQTTQMTKVDTEAMGQAWSDYSTDRRPAEEVRNFTSEAVEKKNAHQREVALDVHQLLP